MSIRRDQTVPFGRSLREYELMFSLSAADRRRRILDCAGFTAELTVASSSACSLDPLYQFAGAEIQRQFFQTLDQVIEQVRATPQKGNGPLYLRLSAIAAVRGQLVRPRALIALLCSCTRITSPKPSTWSPFELSCLSRTG